MQYKYFIYYTYYKMFVGSPEDFGWKKFENVWRPTWISSQSMDIIDQVLSCENLS